MTAYSLPMLCGFELAGFSLCLLCWQVKHGNDDFGWGSVVTFSKEIAKSKVS